MTSLLQVLKKAFLGKEFVYFQEYMGGVAHDIG